MGPRFYWTTILIAVGLSFNPCTQLLSTYLDFCTKRDHYMQTMSRGKSTWGTVVIVLRGLIRRCWFGHATSSSWVDRVGFHKIFFRNFCCRGIILYREINQGRIWQPSSSFPNLRSYLNLVLSPFSPKWRHPLQLIFLEFFLQMVEPTILYTLMIYN